MPKSPSRASQERQAAAVALLQEGIGMAEVAQRFQVTRQAVQQWVARWEAEHGQTLTEKRQTPEERLGLRLPKEPEERARELARLRKEAQRERLANAGMVRFEAWIHPEDRAAIAAYVARLAKRRATPG